MRTLLFLLVGFLLFAASVTLGRLFASNYPGATFAATITFVALWLGISGANRRFEQSRAAASTSGAGIWFLRRVGRVQWHPVHSLPSRRSRHRLPSVPSL